MNIAVLLIGYNRPNCLKRLFNWVNNAFYVGNVDLIISIDNCGSNEVQKMAESFSWTYGEKRIYTYPERLGLKKHILKCGRFLNEYDALIVLEDDILVSPNFFLFSKACVEKYWNDDRVAGISLYTHLWNFGAQKPFEPLNDGYDIYFLQFAQSWGQVWMRKQWKSFYEWLLKNDDEDFSSPLIPSFVKGWPKSSWLKYHIRYAIENNKYFVYPYFAFSTNCSDVGEHNNSVSFAWQVPMVYGKIDIFKLPSFEESTVKYDAFFERVGCKKEINGRLENICFDLYGCKTNYSSRYLVSSRILNYQIIDSYGLVLKPHEANFLNSFKGTEIFLYDLNKFSKNINVEKANRRLTNIMYYHRFYNVGVKSSLKQLIDSFHDKVFKKRKK